MSAKELKQRKLRARYSATDPLILKPAAYSIRRMATSSYQKAVYADETNDFVRAADAIKTQGIDRAVRQMSSSKLIDKSNQRSSKLQNKRSKKETKLKRQESRLKIKKKSAEKAATTITTGSARSAKKIAAQVVKAASKEVWAFFGSVLIPVFLILLLLMMLITPIISMFTKTEFVLGTFAAQDVDLSRAEEYYTKLGYDMNQKILKIKSNDWKKMLNELGADTSNMKDVPSEYIWGNSGKFPYEPVWDFDPWKLWSFICAYNYDFSVPVQAESNKKDKMAFWKFNDEQKAIIEELFNTEYEFECWYDNKSGWDRRYQFISTGYYSIINAGAGFVNIAYPDALPFQGCNNSNTIYWDLSNGQILNYNDGFSATGWYLKNQFVDEYDDSGTKYGAWYVNGEECSYGIYENGVFTVPIPYVIPEESWVCFLKKYDWKIDCRLYYNVKQNKTFEEAILDKLGSTSDSEERIAYYKILVGSDENANPLYGNHQIFKNLFVDDTFKSQMRDGKICNWFGYDMLEWNQQHCSIATENGGDGMHRGIDMSCPANTALFSPLDCTVDKYDADHNVIILKQENVNYWYYGKSGNGKKRDTKIYITNVRLNDGLEEGSQLQVGDEFATTTGDRKCMLSDKTKTKDITASDLPYDYIHVAAYIDTDGYGWDYIDPILVFY